MKLPSRDNCKMFALCSLSLKGAILRLLMVIVMRILELEGPLEVMLHDLQLRASKPSVVPQFDVHGLGHVTWRETFAMCFGSEKYLPFKPWNIDSAGMTYLWRMRVTLLVLGAQSLASLPLAAFHLGHGSGLEGALGSVESWGRAYPC